ncbi:uncharacterized protein LOC115739223 [Rhodamnia argentea]|uniref:Uncharacterized protein LOC115739223 n=1 Tax=Rhodamnia argentea TaxID=178133 RepID=A0A8B8NZU5_9MYRT|nr:uncharacterized protein LOC115739223 [Rhodamnia argentea]
MSNYSCESIIAGEGLQVPFSEAEYWGESRDICSFSDYGFHHSDLTRKQAFLSENQQQEQQQSFTDYGLLDNLRCDVASLPIQTCLDRMAKFTRISTGLQDINEARKDKPFMFSVTLFELLRTYGSRFKRLTGNGILKPHTERRKVELSTSETMRIASAKYVQSSSGAGDDLVLPSHPYYNSFSCLLEDDIRNVQLAEILLDAAEKVGCQQFDAAIDLVDQCDECAAAQEIRRNGLCTIFPKSLERRSIGKQGESA